MITPYIDNPELNTILTAALSRIELDAASQTNWDKIVSDSNEAAANDIVRVLVGRGFTKAQVDAWDSRKEFNRDLGLFWCLVKGGVKGNYDPEFIRMLDRRAELEAVVVTVDGAIPVPEPDAVPQTIKRGMLTAPSDVFSMDMKL